MNALKAVILIVWTIDFAAILLTQPGAAQEQTHSVFGDTFPEVKPQQFLVQRHLYLACIDKEAHQPAWVAYRVNKNDWDTENVLQRNYSTPKDLRAFCLEPADFKKSGYELGHLYALQFVQARREAHEVNQLCAIAAQRPDLNRGPWYAAETRIKNASETQTVTVIAGQLWLDRTEPMANADEPHKVASHCWMIFEAGGVTEAYLFPQTAKRDAALEVFAVDAEKLREQVADHWVGGSKN